MNNNGELDMKNIKNVNDALQQYFRASKRVRINSRKGVFVVVDDKKEAVDLVRKMFVSRGTNQTVLGATNVSEAKRVIGENENGNKVRAVVIDLELDGEGEDGDGFVLANWLNDEHPDIPFIFATGREKRTKEIEREFPGVDIFVKGLHNLDDFACALGLNEEEKVIDECKTIPKDQCTLSEVAYKPSAFSFFKKMIS